MHVAVESSYSYKMLTFTLEFIYPLATFKIKCHLLSVSLKHKFFADLNSKRVFK